jgi:hypothetical protein
MTLPPGPSTLHTDEACPPPPPSSMTLFLSLSLEYNGPSWLTEEWGETVTTVP